MNISNIVCVWVHKHVVHVISSQMTWILGIIKRYTNTIIINIIE